MPIVRDEKGYILDGFARAKIAKELGYECPSVTVKGLSEQEKRSQVRALNLARRHLDYYAKRQIITDELRENPGRSNNWIAKSLGVDDKTVASVRREMQSTSEIPKLGFTLGSDGKYRPATRVSLPTNGNGRLAHELPGAGERDYIDLDDEEGILRAAAQIRQRRVAETAQGDPGATATITTCANQETWRSRPSRRLPRPDPYAGGWVGQPGRDFATVCRAACWSLRGHPRGGLPGLHGAVDDRPVPKMTPDGSVFIVIRPHVRDGVLSDYVLRTRLAVREAGWHECEELIWLKPDAPPLGSKLRPRRAWESILWFSRCPQPYADLKACGKESDRLGFNGVNQVRERGQREDRLHPCVESFGQGNGVARITDVIVANVGGNEPGLDHPAVFPLAFAEQLIKTFSQAGDLVLDNFCGSGQTLLAAKGCGRRYLGIEREEKYVRITLERVR